MINDLLYNKRGSRKPDRVGEKFNFKSTIMKFRSILVACAFLMGMIGSFGFRANDKRQYVEANFYFPPASQCVTSSTEQRNCSTTYTGAQCTILQDGTHYKAWQWMSGPVKNCTVALKQPI
jgi:hypothetical protein